MLGLYSSSHNRARALFSCRHIPRARRPGVSKVWQSVRKNQDWPQCVPRHLL
jgi:hypothetical protein